MAGRERLSPLLRAVVGIGSDLDLRTTLPQIVISACQLADARYGALDIIGPDRTLIEFVTDGVTASEHQVIGDLPTGRGLLGLVIDEPRPVRLDDIAAHPPVVRLAVRPPRGAQLPRRAGTHPRPGLRQPLPDRKA
jgi:two-component system, NarL family, sensor histidine kinase DevS